MLVVLARVARLRGRLLPTLPRRVRPAALPCRESHRNRSLRHREALPVAAVLGGHSRTLAQATEVAYALCVSGRDELIASWASARALPEGLLPAFRPSGSGSDACWFAAESGCRRPSGRPSGLARGSSLGCAFGVFWGLRAGCLGLWGALFARARLARLQLEGGLRLASGPRFKTRLRQDLRLASDQDLKPWSTRPARPRPWAVPWAAAKVGRAGV
jgi:hypothetical protein